MVREFKLNYRLEATQDITNTKDSFQLMYKIIVPAIAAILVISIGLAQDVYAPSGPSAAEIKKHSSQVLKSHAVLERADRLFQTAPEGCSSSENRDGSLTIRCDDGTQVVIDAKKVEKIRDSLTRIGELLEQFQETTDKNGEFWFEELRPE